MKSVRHLLVLLALFATSACGTVSDWRELQSAPMTFGECFDGLLFIAQNSGFAADVTQCDRGNGKWQSRWRFRQLGLGRPGRYRLRAEVMIEEGSNAKGWPLRYVVEQQKVKDLTRSLEPAEEDWSSDYQDREAETILGEKLSRRLAPKV
jgi:hypothetical protein